MNAFTDEKGKYEWNDNLLEYMMNTYEKEKKLITEKEFDEYVGIVTLDFVEIACRLTAELKTIDKKEDYEKCMKRLALFISEEIYEEIYDEKI